MAERMNNKTKDSEIKLRINKKDKEGMIEKAYSMDMNLSSYILKAVGYYDRLQMIPDTVGIWQLCNDVFYAVEQSGDEQLIRTVWEILNNYVQQGHGPSEGGICR